MRSVNLALCMLSLAGLLAGLWAHAVSLAGTDPQSLFRHLWVFQLILFLLLLPVFTQLLRRGIHNNPLDLPLTTRRVLYSLAAYYVLHFYIFLGVAAKQLRSEFTWRMFSAGWLLLFSLAATFYLQRYRFRDPYP